MRFKARIDKEHLITLHTLVSSLERIGTRAAIQICPNFIKISIIFENIDAPRCYSEIPTTSLFNECRVESQSENAILFEVGLNLLGLALTSGKSSEVCQLKLVKRDGKPCLCFEAQASFAVGVLHDIPIKVLPVSDIVYYAPPEVPPPEVALQLPRGRLLRTIVEKMTKFGKTMQIDSSQLGHLTFRMSQSSITVKTFVNGLVPIFTESMDRVRDVDNTASVQIDIRKLSCILSLHNLPWDSAVIYLAHNATLFLELPLLASGTIGFYVPVLLLDAQDEQ
jgi:hypothetical protein